MNNNYSIELQKLGIAQRELEQFLSQDMTNREISGHVLSLSARDDYQLPYKSFQILESWALRTYGGEA